MARAKQPLGIEPQRVASGRAFPAITLGRSAQLSASGRISDSVYEELTEAIRNLQLLPGSPISEPAIAEWLGVSRSPVREAIARLVDLGLVTVKRRVGSYVSPIFLKEVEEASFIRSALETSAFKLAIRDSQPDTTEIQRLVDMNKAAIERDDFDGFFQTDEMLHQNVFELAGMGRIWDMVRRAKVQLDRLRRLSLPRVIKNPLLVTEHQLIVDCLRNRDEKGGVEVIEHHSTRIFHTIEDHRSLYPDYFSD